MALLTIDGVSLPEPSAYQVLLSDLDSESTTRNTSGIMLRDRIRAGVHKVDVKWDLLTRERLRLILNALSPASFQVTFLGMDTGEYITKKMYASDRNCELARCLKTAQPDQSYWSLSVSFTEY